jgi:5-formyltetrahydrofolate cyclo-ligase
MISRLSRRAKATMHTGKPGDSGVALTATTLGLQAPAGAPPPSAALVITDPAQRAGVRERLLLARAQMSERAQREGVLQRRVARWLRTMPMTRLAFFWPVRGEPDLRTVVGEWLAEQSGRAAALPVVVGDRLEFRAWTPHAPMVEGEYRIAVPAATAPLQPQVLLVPCLGVDVLRYRLGYGGGFYDRTLAAMKLRPVTVGVAFDVGRIKSIGPQPHDVRLDLALTESGAL